MIDAVLDFVSEHRDWVFLVALLLAMGETLPVVSIFVPSTTILIGVGALAATGRLDFAPLFAGAALGAIAGSLVAWALGRRFGPTLLQTRPMRRRRPQVHRARRAFDRWGASAVILGHLFGPFRAIAFVMAGLMAMPFARFLPVTTLGAAIWAFVTPKAGELTVLAVRLFF